MKKTLKDCPVHGHGANGLGCYCEKHNSEYEFERQEEAMNNITVGESALKVVVGKKGKSRYSEDKYADKKWVGRCNAIDKTLSTPLPPVEDCVEIDVEKINAVLKTVQFKDFIPDNGVRGKDGYRTLHNNARKRLAKAIANSKSILKWKKGVEKC